MTWQPTPFTAPLLVAAGVSFGLAGYVAWWGRRRQVDRVVMSVLAMLLLAGVWSGGYALQVASPTTGAKILWSKVVTVGAQGVTVAWLGFVLAYTGRESWLRPRRFGVVIGLFLTTVALAFSDPWTEFYFYDQRAVSNDDFAVLAQRDTVFGLLIDPLYILLVVLGIYLLFRHIRSSQDLYRGQALALASTPVAPTAAYLIHLFALGPYPRVNLAPLGFTVTSVLIVYAIVRYRFLELVPVVRDTVVETMTDGYVVVEDGAVIDHNPAATELLDVEADPMGATLDSLLDASVAADGVDQRERVVETTDGDRHLSVSVSALDEPHADHLVLLRDVTERQRIERRYEALIDHSSDLTAIVDPDGSVAYVSPAMERAMGHDAAELEGRRAIDFVVDDDRSLIAETFDATLRKDRPQEAEFRVEDADGNRIVLEAVLRDLRGEPAVEGLVLNAWDVTERKHRTEKLEVLNRMLRHDIRNEMQIIHGTARLLESNVDGEGGEHLDTLQTSADQVVELTNTVRDLMTTMTDDGAEVAPTPLTPVVERACDRLTVPDRGTLTLETPPGDCQVLANELLFSVVRNLLENAINHNDRDDPTVAVTVSRTATPPDPPGGHTPVVKSDVDTDAAYVTVRVADNGPGVPEDRRDAVFGRGEQRADSEGTGVGLYLVRTVVESYGGQVWIEDNDPRGAVFVVVLRAATPE